MQQLPFFFILILFLFSNFGYSQNCDFTLKGQVLEENTEVPLDVVNIYVEETESGAITDLDGNFQIKNLCAGHYHIMISHIGCDPQYLAVDIAGDTTIQVILKHSVTVIDAVVVTEKTFTRSTQNIQELNEQKITDNASQNLSNLLENVSGVSTIRSGSSISKPIVHGLYGNRLTILNNEIAQSGQQWGNDHSPEIDPLVANKLRVVKGVSAIEYPGANLGSVILVEPRKIGVDPCLCYHGKATYFFESNGFGNGLNVQLEKTYPTLAWKVNGTLKKTGDKKAPNYWLNNTGSQEANLALQVEKKFSDRFYTNLYISSFNTELGVFRGSHIGNLTDLELAFNREIPFFTEENFSYEIEAPKQRVNHILAKANAKYFFQDDQWLEMTTALQYNNRKEFDVRRSGRSEIPAMSLQQYTFFAEGKYQQEFANKQQLKAGLQINIIENDNNPETGIFPLIPNYDSYEMGAFGVYTKAFDKWKWELGARYDNVIQEVVTFTTTRPIEVVKYNHLFQNYSASTGLVFKPNDDWSINYNLGVASRNPAINELYSFGLHQGVSGIEEGSTDLNTEHSFKTTLSISGRLGDRLSFEALGYVQQFKDYIFLNPQDEFRLTIRGAFPVFKYEQTDARIYGLDVSGHYKLSESLGLKATYSYIRGMDLEHNMPLLFMPSNNVTTRLNYTISKWKGLENIEFELSNKYVFRQNNLLEGQDFALPPDSYNLIGFQMSGDLQLPKSRLRLFAKADNLLNVAYRDYLNRLRYFADDLGINISLGLSLKF